MRLYAFLFELIISATRPEQMPSFTDALESGNAFIHNYRRSNRQGYWIVTVKYHDQPGHKTFTNVGRSMLSKHLQQMNMDPLPEWKDAYDTVQPSKKRVATEKPKSEPKKKKSKKKYKGLFTTTRTDT